MAALTLLVLLVASLDAALLQPLVNLSQAVLRATWLIWLPLAFGAWLLLADDHR